MTRRRWFLVVAVLAVACPVGLAAAEPGFNSADGLIGPLGLILIAALAPLARKEEA